MRADAALLHNDKDQLKNIDNTTEKTIDECLFSLRGLPKNSR
jgi:hypothetical protein